MKYYIVTGEYDVFNVNDAPTGKLAWGCDWCDDLVGIGGIITNDHFLEEIGILTLAKPEYHGEERFIINRKYFNHCSRIIEVSQEFAEIKLAIDNSADILGKRIDIHNKTLNDFFIKIAGYANNDHIT